MFYIRANGIKIAANCYGDPNKPAVVLIHGGAGSTSGMKGAFPAELKEALVEEYFVVEYDRRGHGYTGYPDSFTFDEQADDVAGVMDAFCIEKAAIIGGSAGTYVGGRAMIRHPQRFSCAVFIGGASHDAGGMTPAAAYFKRMGIDISSLSSEELMHYGLKASFAPMTSRETINAFMESGKLDMEFPAELTAKAFAEMAHWDNRPGFRELNTPVLVITGKYDGLNPPAVGKEMASCFKNGQYLEFEYSAHGPTVEEPERCIKEIKTFFCEQKLW